MYRALALKAIESDASFDEEAPLLNLAMDSRIELQPRIDGNRVLLDGRDISDRIREQDVTDAASRVSVHPLVREWMVNKQREMGVGGGVVMEGRDIGTKVFPHAEVKIFLDAAPEVRGNRRYKQSREAIPEKAAAVVAELRERDQRDRTRTVSPLEPAADAVIIDSTELSLEQVIVLAEEIVNAALARQ